MVGAPPPNSVKQQHRPLVRPDNRAETGAGAAYTTGALIFRGVGAVQVHT